MHLAEQVHTVWVLYGHCTVWVLYIQYGYRVGSVRYGYFMGTALYVLPVLYGSHSMGHKQIRT